MQVPIVAMTANASDRDRTECLNAGMDGFLSKPVLRDRLADAIVQVQPWELHLGAGAATMSAECSSGVALTAVPLGN